MEIFALPALCLLLPGPAVFRFRSTPCVFGWRVRGNNRLSVLSIHALHNRDLLIAAGEERAVLYFSMLIHVRAVLRIIESRIDRSRWSTAIPTRRCPASD